MILSRRERIIGILVLIALAALALDHYVLSPLLAQRAALGARREQLEADMQRAGSLLKRRRLIAPEWRKMLSSGLKRDPAEAESQILHALRNWSEEAGLSLTSLKPERSTDKAALREITVHAAGTGGMYAVSRFLWHLETAAIPVKVKRVHVISRKAGTDDLSLQVRLSTLYLASGSQSPQASDPRAAPLGGER
jgi:hypothetical protein